MTVHRSNQYLTRPAGDCGVNTSVVMFTLGVGYFSKAGGGVNTIRGRLLTAIVLGVEERVLAVVHPAQQVALAFLVFVAIPFQE